MPNKPRSPAAVPIRTPPHDVVVVGNGPGGLILAAALADQGLRVAVIGPVDADGVPPAWVPNYGLWADELDGAELGGFAEHRWAQTRVRTDGPAARVLERGYVRVDRAALRAELIRRVERGGGEWLAGEVVGVAHDRAGSTLRTRDGASHGARVVVDASGHRPVLATRPRRPAPGFQTAVGWTLEGDGGALDAGCATLMDWSDAHLEADQRGAGPATFLYAMPLGADRWFVEETVLVGRPAVPFGPLEQRLRQRLDALGVRVERVLEREECWIPMGGAPPDRRGRTLAFGGAAVRVHPATGYLFARMLRDAPPVAAAVATALGAAGAVPAQAVRAGWDALWPDEALARHALFAFGAELLMRLDPVQTRRFFGIFFGLPEPDWQGYLSDRLPASGIAAAMGRVFARAPADLRAAMIRTSVRSGPPHGAAWLREVVPERFPFLAR